MKLKPTQTRLIPTQTSLISLLRSPEPPSSDQRAELVSLLAALLLDLANRSTEVPDEAR